MATDIAIFRINYKSDFIITLESDAGWSTPFCIKFWTDSPARNYFAGWDGKEFINCKVDETDASKLIVLFDDHNLPVGQLKMQMAWHTTIADFPHARFDEVMNQMDVVTTVEGGERHVELALNGETAPEIAFSLPAYAAEAQRIANEQQRIANEQQRIASEQQRIDNEEARVAEFARLKRESEAATEEANEAAVLATTAADLASAKAQLAQDAANLANQKAQLASDKAALATAAADLATAKAQLAQEKATYAQTQGDYAKTQGDYAKSEGDAVKALNTQMTANEQTRQQNEQARQAAEQQRVTEFEQQMASQQSAYEQAEANRESAFETAEERRDAEVDEKVADITQLRTDLNTFEQEVSDDYARKDGFYETMGVGTAVNLAGQQDRSNPDKFRTSGGTEDIATGTARLEGIKGNAIAWNQLYNDSVPEAITGRTYFIREKVDGVVSKSIQVGAITFTEGSTERNVIDLSLVYNTLTASALPASVAAFEADFKRWFGRALGYEPYDAGSLKNVQITGYKTVGFNLLDPVTGKAHLVGTYGNTNVAQGLYCYEITGNYTAITDEDGNAITPVNGFFMVENPQEITVTGADENTCIHLTWSGWRNGESEPHWSDLSPIDVTTLTGKLNGEGESVVVFPDGMKYAQKSNVGTDIFEEIKVENGVVKAIKRVGSVNLGNLDWTYNKSQFFSEIITNAKNSSWGVSLLCARYPFDFRINSKYSLPHIRGVHAGRVYIVDNNYTSDADLKASLQGVILYYELATPEEYILDNFELPIRFKVDDFGEEEQIGEGVASILTLKYGVNAVDVLRRLPQNYISVESMDKFLAQLGVAMNGTWSRTWNESNQEYDFTFVPNSEPTPENATNQEEA